MPRAPKKYDLSVVEPIPGRELSTPRTDEMMARYAALVRQIEAYYARGADPSDLEAEADILLDKIEGILAEIEESGEPETRGPFEDPMRELALIGHLYYHNRSWQQELKDFYARGKKPLERPPFMAMVYGGKKPVMEMQPGYKEYPSVLMQIADVVNRPVSELDPDAAMDAVDDAVDYYAKLRSRIRESIARRGPLDAKKEAQRLLRQSKAVQRRRAKLSHNRPSHISRRQIERRFRSSRASRSHPRGQRRV